MGERKGHRKFFKEPLCLKCRYFKTIRFEDGDCAVQCSAEVPIRYGKLAESCLFFSHKLGDGYWEQYAKSSMQIPIIGTKKVVDIGYDSARVVGQKHDDEDEIPIASSSNGAVKSSFWKRLMGMIRG